MSHECQCDPVKKQYQPTPSTLTSRKSSRTYETTKMLPQASHTYLLKNRLGSDKSTTASPFVSRSNNVVMPFSSVNRDSINARPLSTQSSTKSPTTVKTNELYELIVTSSRSPNTTKPQTANSTKTSVITIKTRFDYDAMASTEITENNLITNSRPGETKASKKSSLKNLNTPSNLLLKSGTDQKNAIVDDA